MRDIAFIDAVGLPYTGDTLEHRGLGGSESSVIYMSRELVKLGYNVTVYNNCEKPGVYNGVNYKNILECKQCDIAIVLRSISFIPAAKHVILWRHDTYCPGDENIVRLLNECKINEVFTLSDWHTQHTMIQLQVPRDKIFQTRNGYHHYDVIYNKDKDQFIFNAAAYKGLDLLIKEIWPKVKTIIPSAKLKVIGGYYEGLNDDNAKYISRNFSDDTQVYENAFYEITFTGILKPEEVARHMAGASYFIYPCVFPETFGISTLEAHAYGAIPITWNIGALETTAIDNASFKCSLSPLAYPEAFVAKVHEAYLAAGDKERNEGFNIINNSQWNHVAKEWDDHFKGIKKMLPYKQVNLKDKSILIAIPSAVKIEPETFKSIYDLQIPVGFRTDFNFFWCYMIDAGRNQIANYAINCGYDYVLSVDSDMELPKDMLVKMLSHDKDIITGMYRMRRPEQVVEIYDTNYHNIPFEKLKEHQLLEIGGAGFGCVLVKTQVYKDVGYPQFFYHQAWKYEDTFSEDNDFFLKARNKGYKVFCDTSIKCRHKGTVMWEIE